MNRDNRFRGGGVFLWLAYLLLLLALVEKIVNWNGQTLRFMDYSPGRLVEFAAVSVLFCIAHALLGMAGGKRKD